MEVRSRFVDHDGVRIHYLVANEDSSSVPVLICPGLSETAEEYMELMEYLSPRTCVALSFRGRGQSSTPDSGYDLKPHISDIEAVVRDAQLNRFHLFAYSRGVSYALGYVENNASQIMSLILQDYPAEHKQMPAGWVDEYIHQYLIPFSRQRNIRPEAVRGIGKESIQRSLTYPFDKRMLVLRGMLEGSLLDDEGIKQYETMNGKLKVQQFFRSGHDIRSTEKAMLYRVISDFINFS